MNSIAFNVENERHFSTRIQKFFTRYQISSILKQSNAYKKQGFAVVQIVQYLFTLVFQGRSMFLDMQTEKSPDFGKDTVYRLKNADYINWRRFTSLLSSRIIRDIIVPTISEKRRCAFVVDDSVYERNGSRKVELLTRVYDHANKKYLNGFRMLTVSWSDGATLLPVNSCLLSSENPKARINEAVEKQAKTNAAKARKLAQQKATEVVPELIKEAQNAGIKANYVLFDSWFSSPKEILSMKELGLDVVAIVKKSSKIHYFHEGQKQSVKNIFARNKKRRGRSRYLLSAEIEIPSAEENTPAKLVFIRNRSNRNDYLVLLSTDTNLSEDEIIQLYGKRWDIEVFFKVCKSLLRLTKECRSLSYDAMCAHTAIVFMRYMFLAVGIREEKDIRTAGPMFCLVADELADISFAEAMEKLQVFLSKLMDGFSFSKEDIVAFLIDFVASLPEVFADFMQLSA